MKNPLEIKIKKKFCSAERKGSEALVRLNAERSSPIITPGRLSGAQRDLCGTLCLGHPFKT